MQRIHDVITKLLKKTTWKHLVKRIPNAAKALVLQEEGHNYGLCEQSAFLIHASVLDCPNSLAWI